MTTITIPRALLEQALETLDNIPHPPWRDQELADAIRAALAAPDDIAAEMSTVADQYAHKLALDLECVLSEYSGTWYDAAMTTLGAYREAMNAIHERESPTFMGEPVFRPTQAAPSTDDRHAQELLAMEITLQNMAERHAQELRAYELTVQNLRAELEKSEQEESFIPDWANYRQGVADGKAGSPKWHDAPTEPGLWMCNEGDDNPYRWTTHRVKFPISPLLVGEDERWYGPIPQDGGKS